MVTPPVVEWFGGYALALIVGFAIGGWLFSRQYRRDSTSGDGLPRLPVFLRFDRHRVVVVGGGVVAAAKIPALLAAGGNVTVIAPRVSTSIDPARVTIIEREFQPSDLDGAWFVTAAATPEVNRLVREAAEARGVFVNAVDDPVNATAYLGGTIARGGVTVAFSTQAGAGARWLVARSVRRALARRYRRMGRARRGAQGTPAQRECRSLGAGRSFSMRSIGLYDTSDVGQRRAS
jgi:uroporphyrin-III C-methyltransferase/precorrin-2 dehydrogenase/sirohydrochlorin ferrochelatase